MHLPRALVRTTLATALLVTPVGVAAADTAGVSHGPFFQRNVSDTPDLASSKAKVDGLPFYVPSRSASGEAVPIDYRDADGRLVETRSVAKPLVAIYIDDAADPAHGDDVWAAYSLDDGDTWARTNLSMSGARSSIMIGGSPYTGLNSKPALTLKGNRVLAAWTSTYCDSGFPGYTALTADTYDVAGPQRTVDYALQGYPEVGEVPYKCVWTARGLVDQSTGAMTWYQPERLTSGTRYAMQLATNSAPNAGFVVAWGEDPEGLAPGEGTGPGEGWTGANPHPGTDVWYAQIPMSSFNAVAANPVADPDDPAALAARPQPATRFAVPVPVSDNGQLDPADPAPLVGATRPAIGISPYTFAKPDGSTGASAWVAYGYEETKGGAENGAVGVGKKVFHHAFDFKTPDVYAAGDLVSLPGENARRVRYITQPVAQMGPSRTLGALIYRTGLEDESGPADVMMHRFVVPSTDAATDNPFRAADLTAPVNISATSPGATVPDPVLGTTRVTTWSQTAANLDDASGDSALESARGHRGMIKGDFLALGYLWTPNWRLYLSGRDVENYFVRRSFDGGASFTSAPAGTYGGDGVRSCRWFTDSVDGTRLAPVCQEIGPGQFEPAQNLSRLSGLDDTVIEPRLTGVPGTIAGSPYPEDVQDTSVLWQAWGTGLAKEATAGEGDPEVTDPDVPVPDEGTGKNPLDIYYTFSRDYGDTYVANDTIADGPSAQAEVQLRFSPDGSHMYAIWNDLGPTAPLDVFLRRFMPDAFPYNTTPGVLRLASDRVSAAEGDPVKVVIERAAGSRGEVSVGYRTVPVSAVPGTDYTTTSGRVTFAHGDQAPKTILVPTIEDTADAPGVTFRVVLESVEGGAELGTPADALVTIRDDDDVVPPRSRASSPAATNRAVIPIRYTFADTDSGVARVRLYVRTPGSDRFVLAGVDRTVDGRMSYTATGPDGRYRFYTRAVDAAGNVEAAPAVRDSVTLLDRVAPRVLAPSVAPNPFSLVRDTFTRVRFTLLEPATTAVTIRDADGSVVRRLPAVSSPAGVVVQRWFGLSDDRIFAAPGEYDVVVRATDAAGNVTRRHLPLEVRR